MLLERNVKMQVLAAGLNAARTHAFPKEVTDILEREGLSVSDHSSTQLTKELIEKADLILTMEKVHKTSILWHYPQFKNKTFTLKEFAGEPRHPDIKDPYGRSAEAYETCAREIKSNLTKALEKIVNFKGA